MDINWLYVYLTGWLITGTALIGVGNAERQKVNWFVDIGASFAVGLTWPIYLPAKAVNKIFF